MAAVRLGIGESDLTDRNQCHCVSGIVPYS